tara:strand:- start:387 stop:950 length:564 start_codon:yes stop_codon:yes gene_type:complete
MLFKSKPKRRKRKTQKKKISFELINLPIIVLTMISLFFISSFIYEIRYNESDNLNINLQKLLDEQSNDYEKKTGHRITIEVLNGCGQGGIAAMYQKFLRKEGFDVMDAKNALSADGSYNHEQPYSKIEIHRGDIEMAYFLSDLMGINDSLIIKNNNETLMIDISLIIGKDFQILSSYDSVVRHYSRY